MSEHGFSTRFSGLGGHSTRLAVAGGLAAAAGFFWLATSVEAALDKEAQFVLNTFSFLIWGCLVMWMCAGFTMLESGSVRTKNVSMICLKNMGLYAIAGIMYFFIGYNLMYVDVGSVIGSFTPFYGPTGEEIALLAADEKGAAAATDAVLKSSGYATMSDWFFQMVFVATTASIVSGTLAERVRLWTFFVFIILLTGFIYPIVGAWTWGGGWLGAMDFKDFAGSTIVHSTGGWAALAGAIVVGARRGKFRADGSVKSTPPSNIPIVTLGVFILWFGWFGFNGGSQLALGGAVDAVAISHILVNTNLAGAAGFLVALVIERPLLGRIDLMAGLNGALAGLVSITAGPDFASHYWAVIIGAVGGGICVAGLRLLDLLRVDDVVGAIPVHLFAGIWGTLATCIVAGGNFGVQLLGVVAIGVYVFAVSWLVWMALKHLMGVRVSLSVEELGQDAGELGIEAYPEFVVMPDPDDADAVRGNG